MIYEYIENINFKKPEYLICGLTCYGGTITLKLYNPDGVLLQGIVWEIVQKTLTKVVGRTGNWLAYNDNVGGGGSNPNSWSFQSRGDYEGEITQVNWDIRVTYQGVKYATTYKSMYFRRYGRDEIYELEWLIMERV